MAPKGNATGPGAKPSGTVTFLFSDIEGSASRWERGREAMSAALRRHDALLRAAVESHDGYIFKTVGDAFCVAFERPSDGIAAASDAQRALASDDFSSVGGLRVRMALHTGTADERDGDYFGPTVNRVARLMSTAHGGQVLLSGVTRDIAYADLPAGASLEDLGLHLLQDLSEPERVWQLQIADERVAFPPIKSLNHLPNNLPAQLTPLRGRERDLEEVKTVVDQHRASTLTGAGGIGKTRLALQVGAEMLHRFPDGVWVADFAPITDPELVTSVVAQELSVSQKAGRVTDESIAQALRTKHLLIILDNCEHVLEAAAKLADAVNRHCPNVRILATSRQALSVSGEKLLRVASLAVPDRRVERLLDSASDFGALELFVDRASLVDQSFALDEDNVHVVADICRHLDGIPLAIELAAARVRVMSVHNLARRLDERFKILTDGGRTVLPRQKTLGALIDWSYDLLAPAERTLFERLAIFAGTFTTESAAVVCGGEEVKESDVLDLITSLADKSLVMADTHGRRERFWLLESIRAYALEKLVAAGRRDEMARRHAQYFLDAARDAQRRFGSQPLAEWLAAAAAEVENFRSALEWTVGRDQDALLGGSIASALDMYWWHGGLEAEGRRWLERSLRGIDAEKHADVAALLRRALQLLTSRMLFS